MRPVRFRLRFLFLTIAVPLALLACDVASLIPQNVTQNLTQKATPDEPGQVAPTTATGAGKTAPSPAAKDASSRISDSLNRLVIMEQKVLDSYHLEVSGTEPVLNKTTQKIESQAFTFKADVSGDNIHFVKTTPQEKETTTEAYIMGASAKDGGKGYSVKNGVVKEDLFAALGWAFVPLEYGLPLIYGAMGPTPRGDEAVDGRAAEKFDLDTAKAPTGTAGIMKGIGFNVHSSKGTAWIDKQTAALLKMNIDYERDVSDTSGGKVVGKGNGHIELMVTQVGKVTVALPDLSKQPTGPAPTKAAAATTAPKVGGAAPTSTRAGQKATPVPTATPPTATARVGQRVVQQGLAFTVTKVEKVDKGAYTGNQWIIVHLNVENVGGEDTSIELGQFVFIDRTGKVYDDLVNAPSAPDAYSDDVLGYEELAPGDKLQNKLLLRQMTKTLVQGLKLKLTTDDIEVVWNLGL